MGATIHDIAREAGVSIAAVSKALNDREGVSDELRNRIKAIAERLQYGPYLKSLQRGRVAQKQHNQIAVVYDQYGSHLFEELRRGVDTILPVSGYREVKFTTSFSELTNEATKKLFLQKILDDPLIVGALFVFIPLTDGDVALFRRRSLPVVQLNVDSDAGRCIAIDHVASAYEATEKFIQMGHRIIGHILPHDWLCPVWRDRLAGYKKALQAHGIEYDGSWVGNDSTFVPQQSGLVTRELLLNNPEMTAILYTSDLQAMGGLKMLHDMGVKVPEEVAVIGFDNTKMCDLVQPPLASVELPMFEMGRTGAEFLIDGIRTKTFVNEKKILTTRLVVRRSCDPAAPIASWIPVS